MSYRFKLNQPIADNVRRIAAEEIESAVSHLSAQGSKQREKDIHEARKSIKRLRALLRLVRPELGSLFRKENVALRDIGRSLSALRDASIVLETFDALSPAASVRRELQSARNELQKRKKAGAATADVEKILGGAAHALAEVGKRVSQWPFGEDGFEVIAEGLKGEYQSGRKAMTKALKKDDSLIFHEWRKRAKCQLYHMRLLKNIFTEPLHHQEALLHDLETVLGDDHNLLILRQNLGCHPKALGGKQIVEQSLDLVSEREKQLRSKSAELGKQIYQQRPREFVLDLRTAWDRALTERVGRAVSSSTAA